jgi:hypothetical protein
MDTGHIQLTLLGKYGILLKDNSHISEIQTEKARKTDNK